MVSGVLVKALRQEILACEEGLSLGSEPQLLQRFNVGRSTLRQAVRVLEVEQLLRVRRGANGGYFTCRPDEGTVARAAALYLRLRGANLGHQRTVGRVLSAEVHRMAAESTDQAAREEMRRVLEPLKAARGASGLREFVARAETYRKAVARLAGNPFLELFFGITYLFGKEVPQIPVFTDRPDRIAQWEDIQWRLNEAVLNAEPEVGSALAVYRADLMATWLDGETDDAALDLGAAPSAARSRATPLAKSSPMLSGTLAKILREEILEHQPGWNLGSEAQLLRRFNVGRSTLRQAARVLEVEQLLRVRRGANGGYFTRRPNESAVAQVAALYLSLRNTTARHQLAAGRMLNMELHRLAAASNDQAARDEVRAMLEPLREASPEVRTRDFIARTEIYKKAMTRLADNPLLELFVGITQLFGGLVTHAPVFGDHPDRVERWENIQWRLNEAVLNGEPQVAAALTAHRYNLMTAWLESETSDDRLDFSLMATAGRASAA